MQNYQLLYWEDVRKEVRQVNPELAELIDQINPDKRYPLVKIRYRFGDLIVDRGITYLPNSKGTLLPVNHPDQEKILYEHLSYSCIPMFMSLKNGNEVFINSLSRTVPLNLFYPGSLLGLFESLDFMFGNTQPAVWCVSAGARNLFTLPKINEASGFNRLKATFNLDAATKPRYLSDHWNVFRAIAQHKNFNASWNNDVLFFTKNWLSNDHKSSDWFAFKNYLFKSAWHQAQLAIELGVTWEHFAEAISIRNLKPTPYVFNHVKHILLIAIGRRPGFRPADESNKFGPIQSLQKAIAEVYLLKKHMPTIMHSSSLENDKNIPLYYSLSYPSLLEGPSQNNAATTIMSDIREIKHLIDSITPVINDLNKIKRKHSQFDYFHVESDKYDEIKQSKIIPMLDKTVISNNKNLNGREFCSSSQFWRGCVKISELGPRISEENL
jgi:hypothetical protein